MWLHSNITSVCVCVCTCACVCVCVLVWMPVCVRDYARAEKGEILHPFWARCPQVTFSTFVYEWMSLLAAGWKTYWEAINNRTKTMFKMLHWNEKRALDNRHGNIITDLKKSFVVEYVNNCSSTAVIYSVNNVFYLLSHIMLIMLLDKLWTRFYPNIPSIFFHILQVWCECIVSVKRFNITRLCS